MRPVGGHSEDGLTPRSALTAERLRLEALDEDDAQTQHEPEVIGVEDRADGLILADLSLSVCMSVAVVTDVSLRECCVLAPSECSIWFLCPSSFGSARVSCPGLRFWSESQYIFTANY